MANTLSFDIDDSSPTIQYSPFSDTLSTPNLSAGWNPYYDQSGFAPAQGGSVGIGKSLHITSFNGATVSVQWHGTGIQLIGNATLASYQVIIDGQITEPRPDASKGILASIDGLDNARHTVTLIAQIPPESLTDTSSMLVFDKAILTSSPMPTISEFKPEAINDSDISLLGNWSRDTRSVNESLYVSRTVGDRVMATFTGSSLLVQGKTSPGAADYQVILDNSTVITSFSGRSSFTTFNTTLYFATGLDPSIKHSVEVRNVDGGELALLVGGFNTFTPVSPLSGPTGLPNSNDRNIEGMALNKGTLAALILGGILAFLLLSAILYYFLIYRPRRRRDFTYRSEELYPRNTKWSDPAMEIGQRISALGADSHGGVVHGEFRGIDLSSVDEKKDYGYKQGASGWSAEAVSIPPSDDSSARRKAKRKGKSRQILRSSWSQSIKLEVPLGRPRRTNSNDLSSSSQAPYHPSGGYFTAAPPSPVEFPAAPPSYAASTSHHTTNSSFPSSLAYTTGTRQHHEQSLTPPHSADSYSDRHNIPPSPPHTGQDPEDNYRYSPANQPPIFATKSHQRYSSLLDPPSMHEVLRSLSPRTSVRPSSGVHVDGPRNSYIEDLGDDVPLRHSMLPDLQSVSEVDHKSQLSKGPTNADAEEPQSSDGLHVHNDDDDASSFQDVTVGDGLFLSVTETSPFRVDFDLRSLHSRGSRRNRSKTELLAKTINKESKKRSRLSSALSHVRFETMSGHSRSSASSKRLSMPTLAPEFVQGTSKVPFRLTPLTLASSKAGRNNVSSPTEGATSFLDFTSTYEASILSRSRSTKTVASFSEEFGKWGEPVPPLPSSNLELKSRWSNTSMPSDVTGSSGSKKHLAEPKSRWSSTTVPSLSTQAHGLPVSLSSSRNVTTGAETEGGVSTDSSTFPIQFKMTIPSSPHHVMQSSSTSAVEPQSKLVDDLKKSSSKHQNRQSQANSGRAPTLASSSSLAGSHVHSNGLDSPTDSSYPMSVSEIHFHRPDSDVMASRRTTYASSSMPLFTNPEDLVPPLPDEYRPRPFDPSILVNRVLGLPSPEMSDTISTSGEDGIYYTGGTLGSFASPDYARTPSPRR